MKTLILALTLCALLSTFACATPVPAQPASPDTVLVKRMDSLSDSLTKLQRQFDDLKLVREQKEVLLEAANENLSNAITILDVTVGISGVIVAVILGFVGYVYWRVNRSVEKFDKKYEQIATAESQLSDMLTHADNLERKVPDILSGLEHRFEQLKKESAENYVTKVEIQNEVDRLQRSILPVPDLKGANEPDRKEISELSLKIAELERLGGNLTSEDYYKRGLDQYFKNLYDLALHSTEQAIELDPKNASAWANMGTILRKLDRRKEALIAYEEALRIVPRNASFWTDKGIVLAELGRLGDAQGAFDSATQLKPKNAVAWANKGYLLFLMSRHKNALEALNKAIDIDTDTNLAYYNRAVLYAHTAEYSKATADLRKAIELVPGHKRDAKNDKDFIPLRDNPEFRKLVGLDDNERGESGDSPPRENKDK